MEFMLNLVRNRRGGVELLTHYLLKLKVACQFLSHLLESHLNRELEM
jgi:hypothetical protein